MRYRRHGIQIQIQRPEIRKAKPSSNHQHEKSYSKIDKYMWGEATRKNINSGKKERKIEGKKDRNRFVFVGKVVKRETEEGRGKRENVC